MGVLTGIPMNTLLAPVPVLSAETPAGPAAAPSAPMRVVIRDLVLMAEVGIYDHEQGRRQRVRVGLDLETDPREPAVTAGEAAAAAQAVLASGHIMLLETMAERMAARCLADPRVRSVRVRVEKPDIFPDATVGVEFERRRV